MPAAKGWRLVEVTCRDLVERPRKYQAGISLREAEDTGFRCAKCGEVVPLAGNEIHNVRSIGRAEREDR